MRPAEPMRAVRPPVDMIWRGKGGVRKMPDKYADAMRQIIAAQKIAAAPASIAAIHLSAWAAALP